MTWGDYPTIDPTIPDVRRVSGRRGPQRQISSPKAIRPTDRTAHDRNVGTVPVTATPQVIVDGPQRWQELLLCGVRRRWFGRRDLADGAVANTPIGYVLGDGLQPVDRDEPVDGAERKGRSSCRARSPTANGSPLGEQDHHDLPRRLPPRAWRWIPRTSEVTTTTGGKLDLQDQAADQQPVLGPVHPGRRHRRLDQVRGHRRPRGDLPQRPTRHDHPGWTRAHLPRPGVRRARRSSPAAKICWQSTAGGSWGGGSCGVIRDDGSYVLRLKPGANADGKYRVYSPTSAPYYVALEVEAGEDHHPRGARDTRRAVAPPRGHSAGCQRAGRAGSSRTSATVRRNREPVAPSMKRWSNESDSVHVVRTTSCPRSTHGRSCHAPDGEDRRLTGRDHRRPAVDAEDADIGDGERRTDQLSR